MTYFTLVKKGTDKPWVGTGKFKSRCILYTSSEELEKAWIGTPSRTQYEIAIVNLTVDKPEQLKKKVVKKEKTSKIVIPPKCPLCNKMMVKRTNRSLGNEFWGCSNYPDCKGSRNVDGTVTSRGKFISEDELDNANYPDNDW